MKKAVIKRLKSLAKHEYNRNTNRWRANGITEKGIYKWLKTDYMKNKIRREKLGGEVPKKRHESVIEKISGIKDPTGGAICGTNRTIQGSIFDKS